MITLREVFIEVELWWKVGFDRSTHMRIYVRRETVNAPSSSFSPGRMSVGASRDGLWVGALVGALPSLFGLAMRLGMGAGVAGWF